MIAFDDLRSLDDIHILRIVLDILFHSFRCDDNLTQIVLLRRATVLDDSAANALPQTTAEINSRPAARIILCILIVSFPAILKY